MMMTETMTHTAYVCKTNRIEERDGFREQVILLDNLREKLDEYFSLRKTRNP